LTIFSSVSGEKYVDPGTQSGLGITDPLMPLLSLGFNATGCGQNWSENLMYGMSQLRRTSFFFFFP
jgi:hypothetical protein